MSNVNLHAASRQWAQRSADERFWTPEEMHAALQARRQCAATAKVTFGALSVRPAGDQGLQLLGEGGHEAGMTNWAFDQLCARIGAPAAHYASLPAPLVAPCVNHLIAKAEDRGQEARLLFALTDEGMVTRALTGVDYGRFWDVQVASRLIDLQAHGWRVPPARPSSTEQPGARIATQEDVLTDKGEGGGLSINVGDWIAPAGLYAGDRDLFAFMVNENARIEDGTSGGLSRGFFIQNSEVGKSALHITAFLYRHVCGNHIVWGAESVRRLSIRHTKGNLDAMFSALQVKLVEYATAGVAEDRLRVKKAQTFQLAGTKEDVIDLLFAKAIGSRKMLDAAYVQAEVDSENPRTAWGMAQGVTRLSQQQVNADKRAEMDAAAGRILQVAF